MRSGCLFGIGGEASGFRSPTRCVADVIPVTWGAVWTLQYAGAMRLVIPFVLALVVVGAGRTASASVGSSSTALVMPAGIARLVVRDASAHAGQMRFLALVQLLRPSREALMRRDLPVRPVPGEPTSGFGMRKDPMAGHHGHERHPGLDLEAHMGTPVVAAGNGTVVSAGHAGGYGRMVVIDHGDGVQTRYAHLSQIIVRRGQQVAAGQRLGKSGATGRVTGPHLHFEVRLNGAAVDPEEIVAAQSTAVSASPVASR
jgi:murein DD-endopeptidase MepM/ murein hydrolase activator NlpD